MAVLITGANGFLGSHIVDQALEADLTVLAGVRENSNLKFLEGKDVSYIFTDLNQLDQVRVALESYKKEHGEIDYLIHNAGVTKADTPEDFMHGNADLSRSFYELILDVFPSLKKILFVSSMAAGGPGAEDMIPLTYGYPEEPMTPYGKSKKRAEEYLRSLESKVDHIILRPTAIYGPRESKMLPMIKMLNRGIEVEFSDERQRLSFVHAEDLAKLMITAILSNESNKTYLVSDGGFYRMSEYRKIVKQYLGLKTRLLRISPQFLRNVVILANRLKALFGRKMHFTPEKVKDITALNWKVDTQALVEDFDFKPEFDLKSGLEQTLDWYIAKEWI